MKQFLFAICAICVLSTTGCIKPYDTPEFVMVENFESAFVVPVAGANKTEQGKFDSADYLNNLKVATKRIQIPHEWVQTGRWSHYGEWVGTVRVLKVNRQPVSREWTVDSSTGTAKNDQAIYVESKDSIGFYVGVTISAQVEEGDTALYLYRFPTGKPLSSVIDTDIRSFLQAELSAEFGRIPLEDKYQEEFDADGKVVNRTVTVEGCKTAKTKVFKEAADRVKTYYKNTFGITIFNIGHVGGLTYEDKEIQEAINATFLAEKRIETARMEKEEQHELNDKALSIEVNNRKKAEEFNKALDAQREKIKLEIERMRAEADLERAKRWNGALPANILPENSPLLLGVK